MEKGTLFLWKCPCSHSGWVPLGRIFEGCLLRVFGGLLPSHLQLFEQQALSPLLPSPLVSFHLALSKVLSGRCFWVGFSWRFLGSSLSYSVFRFLCFPDFERASSHPAAPLLSSILLAHHVANHLEWTSPRLDPPRSGGYCVECELHTELKGATWLLA